MSVTIAIGIDIAKDSFALCWASATSAKTPSTASMYANTQAGCEAAHQALLDQDITPATSAVVLEATGVYWEACALFFHQHGYQVSVVNPARVAAFARSELRRSKTDALDAALLTRFGLRMEPVRWQPPALDMEALPQLMRQRDAYVHLRTQVLNQQHALEHHAHPCQEAVESIQRTINNLEQEIMRVETAFKNRLAQHADWQTMLERLMTITGVGFVIAATILAETKAFTNFHTSAQLCAYAGIAPVVFRSGTSVCKRDHISKIGNPRLRRAAYQAAVCAVRFCDPIRAFYQRLVARGKPKKVALVAVARKMLRIAFALITQGKDFDSEFLSKSMRLNFD